jgi:4-amino-4-deoxy-L-arabinose transferase-like glycosyltransferase
MREGSPAPGSGPGWWGEIWIPAALASLALALRLVHLDHSPNLDEFLHILAAREYLANGTLDVLGEPYDRARLFTWSVIGLMQLFGDGLVVARIPSVVAGTVLVLVVYGFVRWQADRVAGAVAGFLLATWPTALYLSQVSRFYALHALAIFLAGAAVYAFTLPDRPLRFRLLALGLVVPPAALAWHLQPITLVGLGALGVWVVLSLGFEAATRTPPGKGRLVGAGAALLFVLGVLVALRVISSEWFTGMWGLFQRAPDWAAEHRNELGYYHRRILRDFPALWGALPLVLLVAASARPRLTLFSSTFLLIALSIHSLAAWKVERYLFYALPFFFVVSGVALAEVIRRFPLWVARALEGAGGVAPRPTVRRGATWLLALGTAIFFLGTTPAIRTSLALMDRDPDGAQLTRSYGRTPAWASAAAELAPLLTEPGLVVVGVTPLPTRFHLGRVDFTVGESPGLSFTVDPHRCPDGGGTHGVGEIRSPEALEQVLACHAKGIVVVDRSYWRIPWGVTDPVADALEESLIPLEFPEGWGLVGFTWSSEAPPHNP